MKRRMNKKSVLSIILCVVLLSGLIGDYTRSSAEEAESNTKETESMVLLGSRFCYGASHLQNGMKKGIILL